MRAKSAFPTAGPTKPKPKPDVNKGANALKSRIVAHMRKSLAALERKHGAGTLPTLGLKHELTWLMQSDERAAKKAGGIGRR